MQFVIILRFVRIYSAFLSEYFKFSIVAIVTEIYYFLLLIIIPINFFIRRSIIANLKNSFLLVSMILPSHYLHVLILL